MLTSARFICAVLTMAAAPAFADGSPEELDRSGSPSYNPAGPRVDARQPEVGAPEWTPDGRRQGGATARTAAATPEDVAEGRFVKTDGAPEKARQRSKPASGTDAADGGAAGASHGFTYNCEDTAGCEKAETLRALSSLGEQRALVRAQSELRKAQNELNQLNCEAQKNCRGKTSEEEAMAKAQQEAAAAASASSQPTGIYYLSVFGVGDNAMAELMVDGSRVPVRVGTKLSDGSVVASITTSGVFVDRGGQVIALPGVGALIQAQRSARAGK